MKFVIRLLGILLLCFVLSACMVAGDDSTDNTVDDSSLTSRPVDIDIDHQQRDGDEFEGQPVYSLTEGVSQAAHDAFAACGLDDSVIETLVRAYLENGAEKQILAAGEIESEPLWEVVMTVEPLTPDVYLVTCSGERP